MELLIEPFEFSRSFLRLLPALLRGPSSIGRGLLGAFRLLLFISREGSEFASALFQVAPFALPLHFLPPPLR